MKTWIGVALFVTTVVAACGDGTETSMSTASSGEGSMSGGGTASASTGGVGGQGGAGTGECQAVSDCRLETNDCETCTCLSLPGNMPVPKCDGTKVECLVDPCVGLEATCSEGKCGSQQIDG